MELGHRIIVVINKIDRPDARPVEVNNEIFDLFANFISSSYNNIMFDETIITESPVGQRLEMMSNKDAVSYLMFNNKRIDLVRAATKRKNDEDSKYYR